MPYRYLAYSPTGEITQGVLDVESEETAERILWERDLMIAELKHVRTRTDLIRLFPTLLGPKPRDTILFSRQLATLVDSGVAITTALQLLSGHITNKGLRTILRQIDTEVRMGTSLSEAMSKHSPVFPRLYVRMIEVAERTGNFGAILRQLVSYMEKAHALTRKIRSAMAYPAFVLGLAVIVVLIIINIALPPMIGLFEEFNAQLPWTTRLLMAITNFMATYRLHIFLSIIVTIACGAWYATLPFGRRHRDLMMLKLPFIRQIHIQGTVAKLSRTMATLLQAGIALPEVMELTKQTIDNVILQEALDSVREETLQGRGLSEPLARSGLFPDLMPFMIRIGEETGTLDSHLETLADFYEEEVDRAIKALTSMLEPAMTIIVGLIVGFVAVSVIMPMYNLLGAIR